MRSGLSRIQRITTKIVKYCLCNAYIVSSLLSRICLATPALRQVQPIELAMAVTNLAVTQTNTHKVGVSSCSYWSSQFHMMYSSKSRTRRAIREVQPPPYLNLRKFFNCVFAQSHKYTIQGSKLYSSR